MRAATALMVSFLTSGLMVLAPESAWGLGPIPKQVKAKQMPPSASSHQSGSFTESERPDFNDINLPPTNSLNPTARPPLLFPTSDNGTQLPASPIWRPTFSDQSSSAPARQSTQKTSPHGPVPLRPVQGSPPLRPQFPQFKGTGSFGNAKWSAPLLKAQEDTFGAVPERTNSAKTADELLEQLAKGQHHWYVNPELPTDEIGKAVEALRSRFPISSVRERLHFQAKHPKAFEPKEQQWYRERYASALQLLHSENVEDFIQSEGQGLGRITPISPNDLFDRQRSIDSIASVPVDSDLLSEKPLALNRETKTRNARMGGEVPDYGFVNKLSPNGMPKEQLLAWFNTNTARSFADRVGFVRNVDEVAGFESHRVNLTYDPGHKGVLLNRPPPALPGDKAMKAPVNWKLNRIQLVSLLLHEDPSVYVTDKLPDMESLSGEDAPTRKLDPFESEGLAKLKSGQEIHVHASLNRIKMLGAIRAGEKCLQCHSVEKDAMLGAFSYEFLRDPRLTD